MPHIWFLQEVTVKDRYCFYVQMQKVHMNGFDFCQTPQNFIFGKFLGFLEPLTYQCFPKNRAASHFLLYNSQAKDQKKLMSNCIATERTNEWINRLTDNWTNKVKFIWDQDSSEVMFSLFTKEKETLTDKPTTVL